MHSSTSPWTATASRPSHRPDHPAGSAKVLDAGGAFATAGLTDGHSHWIWGAGMLDWLDLVDLRSLDDILEATSIPTP
ncbi:MAG: hypothetical protein R2705_04975 [Ilumatobacteraceae bacterium]